MGQLADKLKAKYPQYGDIPDDQLEAQVLAKHPEYKDLTGPSIPQQEEEEPNSDYLKGLGKTILPGALIRQAVNANERTNQDVERIKGSQHPLLEIGKIGLEENPITGPIFSGINRAKRFAGMGENQEPVTKALRYSQAALAPIPVLGDAMESGDKAIMGPEGTSKEGWGELGGHLANALLPAISPAVGRGLGSAGKSIYKSAFPAETSPNVLDLMIDEGIRGSQKGMGEQVASKIMDKTQEMAGLENSANPNLKVDVGPTINMLRDKILRGRIGATSESPTLERELRTRLDQMQKSVAGQTEKVPYNPMPAKPSNPPEDSNIIDAELADSHQIGQGNSIVPYGLNRTHNPELEIDQEAPIIDTTAKEILPSTKLPFRDALRLKRGIEYEGDVAGAFRGNAPMNPKQKVANMATGGMINDIGTAFPEYSKTTGGLAKLLDAKQAIQGARPLRTDLPYRYGPPAIASAEVYRSLHNPILAALTGGGAMELQRALTSPAGLTRGGAGMLGLGNLLRNPGIRAALLGMGQQGQDNASY